MTEPSTGVLASLACGLLLVSAWTCMAEVKPGQKVELKGMLTTGVVAIGGETTGTTLKVDKMTYELDFAGNKDLQAQAEKLNGKTAIVKGTYAPRPGVEVKERHIVRVTAIKPG